MLDLSRLVPGPYATLLLSDLGADVIKVEDPAPGDYLREISAQMYAALNRGKRSVCVDLKSEAGRAQLRSLCATADVLVEGFRPGVLARLGFGGLLEEFPRLVVCSISGFGQTGPWRERAGHDIGYIALSGLLSRCTSLPGVQLADLFGGGQQAVIAILAALLERGRSGRGQWLDVSMTDGATGFMVQYAGTDTVDVLKGIYPCYRMYECRGGGRFVIGALEPKFWERCCKALGRPGWAGRGFDAALTPEVDALFAGRTRDEWDALLRPADCCSEPVLTAEELAAHPLLTARELYIDGMLRSTPALVPTGALKRTPAPALGEHTSEVFRELSAL